MNVFFFGNHLYARVVSNRHSERPPRGERRVVQTRGRARTRRHREKSIRCIPASRVVKATGKQRRGLPHGGRAPLCSRWRVCFDGSVFGFYGGDEAPIKFPISPGEDMGDEAAAAPATAAGGGAEEKVIHTYPLVRHSDMPEEMRLDAIEVTQTACEKYAQNNELAARMVKELMDKKYGPSFHVVVGESYGFEITHECTTILYMYFGGNQAICIWKCS